MKSVTLVVVLIIQCQIVGCTTTEWKGKEEYLCVRLNKCVLPEAKADDESLVYLISPTRFINEFEKHEVYINEDAGGEKYIGRIYSGIYCAIKTKASTLRIRSQGGRNNADIVINVSSRRIYYLLYSVDSGLFSSKLGVKMKQIDEGYGEDLLKDKVIHNCAS